MQRELEDLPAIREKLTKAEKELDTLKGLRTIISCSLPDAKRVTETEKDPEVLATWVQGLKRLTETFLKFARFVFMQITSVFCLFLYIES